MNFDAVVTGDTAITARFNEWPAELHDDLLAKITDLTARLEDRVLGLAPVKTGKLKSSIVEKIYDDGTHIAGRVTVDADFIKAASLEYGHRIARGGKGSKAGGVKMSKLLARFFGANAPGGSTFEATIANLAPAYPFLHPALTGIEADAVTGLQSVIDQKAKAF